MEKFFSESPIDYLGIDIMTNDVPLKEYIEKRLDERYINELERIRALESKIASLERLMEAKLAGMQIAVTKQERTYDERFEKVNEFRASLSDLSNRQVAQPVFTSFKETTAKDLKTQDYRLSSLESRLSGMDGKIIGWSGGVGFVVLIITVVLVFVK